MENILYSLSANNLTIGPALEVVKFFQAHGFTFVHESENPRFVKANSRVAIVIRFRDKSIGLSLREAELLALEDATERDDCTDVYYELLQSLSPLYAVISHLESLGISWRRTIGEGDDPAVNCQELLDLWMVMEEELQAVLPYLNCVTFQLSSFSRRISQDIRTFYKKIEGRLEERLGTRA